jgi:hypothetical protein
VNDYKVEIDVNASIHNEDNNIANENAESHDQYGMIDLLVVIAAVAFCIYKLK